MRRAREFPFDVLSVGAARRFATDALGDVPTDVLDAVELMVSELATNSIRHAKTGFQLAIARARASIRVEVTDLGGGVPKVRSPAPTDPTGRGLAIVEMFSDAWGVEYAAPTDTTVWFTLAWAAERRDCTQQSSASTRRAPVPHTPAPHRRRGPSCCIATCRGRPRSARRSCGARGQ